MRYGTNKEKKTKLGEGLINVTGKGEHGIRQKYLIALIKAFLK